jgi:hypothetical protein
MTQRPTLFVASEIKLAFSSSKTNFLSSSLKLFRMF